MIGEPHSSPLNLYAGSFSSCKTAIEYAKKEYPYENGWDKYICIREEYYVK